MAWQEERPWQRDSGFRIDLSGNVKWVAVLVILTIVGLFYFQSTTGSYLQSLEKGKAGLEGELTVCKDEKTNATYQLDACNIDLGTCQRGITDRDKQLEACSGAGSAELLTCQNSLTSWKESYDKLESNYLICEGSVKSLNESYNDMALMYAKDKCCDYRYYYVDDNDEVICTNETSERTISFGC